MTLHTPTRAVRSRRRAVAGLGALATVAVLTTGCGADDDRADAESGSTATTSAAGSDSTTRQAAAISATDAWVKAVDSGMTAAFGEIRNPGDADITIVSASTSVSSAVELHETVTDDDGTMAMQPRAGGFVVPAGGTLTLEPGGDHLMFMDVTRALEPGQTVPVTLALSDGSTMEIDAVVKSFAGADETYRSGDDMSSEKLHQHADGSLHDHSDS